MSSRTSVEMSRGYGRAAVRSLLPFVIMLFGHTALAQLVSGSSESGFITPVGDVDTWTVTANAGDALLVQVGELSGTNFNPQLDLFDPNGALVESLGL